MSQTRQIYSLRRGGRKVGRKEGREEERGQIGDVTLVCMGQLWGDSLEK